MTITSRIRCAAIGLVLAALAPLGATLVTPRSATRVAPLCARLLASSSATLLAVIAALAATLLAAIVALAATLLVALAVTLLAPTPASAEWVPSPELRFRAVVDPDTLTVGDPIVFQFEGSAPDSGRLLQPTFQDSVGPFTILGSENVPVANAPEGRVSFSRRIRLTAFETGRLVIPAVPLLWVTDSGDTAVAYSDSLVVEVESVLPDSVATADPQAALAQLRGVKGVVQLEPSRLWLYLLLGVLGAAVLGWIAWRLLRARSGRTPREVALPLVPALPPETLFQRGLDALLAKRWIEKGEFKEYYAELSLLLRRYIEGRFQIPAVEETQREIVEAVSRDSRIERSEVEWLRTWLGEGDLVKFARMDALSADANRAAEEAANWVRVTTRRSEERAAAADLVQTGDPPGDPPGRTGPPPTLQPVHSGAPATSGVDADPAAPGREEDR